MRAVGLSLEDIFLQLTATESKAAQSKAAEPKEPADKPNQGDQK